MEQEAGGGSDEEAIRGGGGASLRVGDLNGDVLGVGSDRDAG